LREQAKGAYRKILDSDENDLDALSGLAALLDNASSAPASAGETAADGCDGGGEDKRTPREAGKKDAAGATHDAFSRPAEEDAARAYDGAEKRVSTLQRFEPADAGTRLFLNGICCFYDV
jgi:hypothetical protein